MKCARARVELKSTNAIMHRPQRRTINDGLLSLSTAVGIFWGIETDVNIEVTVRV